MMKLFTLLTTCLILSLSLLSQNETVKPNDSTEHQGRESYSIGIITSLTEGVGFGYRYWSEKRWGLSFSYTPLFIEKRYIPSAGASILYRFLKNKSSYSYINTGVSYSPLITDENTFTTGVGFGYEWNLLEIIYINLKIDAVVVFEKNYKPFILPIPFPGIGILFKI